MRMTTKELDHYLKKTIKEIVGIFANRNEQYSTTGLGTSNFVRNAGLNKIYRIAEIIDKPYGLSIEYIIQKVDRLIGGIISTLKKPEAVAIRDSLLSIPIISLNVKYTNKFKKTIIDSIDDSIVYLLITKALLKEEGLI